MILYIYKCFKFGCKSIQDLISLWKVVASGKFIREKLVSILLANKVNGCGRFGS